MTTSIPISKNTYKQEILNLRSEVDSLKLQIFEIKKQIGILSSSLNNNDNNIQPINAGSYMVMGNQGQHTLKPTNEKFSVSEILSKNRGRFG